MNETNERQTFEPPWPRGEFIERIMALRSGYHLEHPFQKRMNAGSLSHVEMQAWVINRYYYQCAIPRKDAAILAQCPHREIRRAWVQRILDQDGRGTDAGGLESWLRLGEACGLRRDDVASLEHVLPGTRFAVDAYVNFARTAPWTEGVCASLTELFAPEAHRARLDSFPVHYPWIEREGLDYFRSRLSQARRDVEHGLEVTLTHFHTRALQERALEIVQFKLNVLCSLLDAVDLAYGQGKLSRSPLWRTTLEA